MLRDLLLTVLAIVWAVILVLVGGRFLALLAGANPDSELIKRLYDYSDFWVSPFFGILGLSNKAVDNTGGVFEPASLIAFIVYFLLGAIVLRFVRTAGYGVMRHA